MAAGSRSGSSKAIEADDDNDDAPLVRHNAYLSSDDEAVVESMHAAMEAPGADMTASFRAATAAAVVGPSDDEFVKVLEVVAQTASAAGFKPGASSTTSSPAGQDATSKAAAAAMAALDDSLVGDIDKYLKEHEVDEDEPSVNDEAKDTVADDLAELQHDYAEYEVSPLAVLCGCCCSVEPCDAAI